MIINLINYTYQPGDWVGFCILTIIVYQMISIGRSVYKLKKSYVKYGYIDPKKAYAPRHGFIVQVYDSRQSNIANVVFSGLLVIFCSVFVYFIFNPETLNRILYGA